MADKVLTLPWEAIQNRSQKVGVGAYLIASDTTAVTTTYTRLEGTFTNVALEWFEIDEATSKLKYSPVDGIARTFKLDYSGELKCPGINDVATVGIELTRDSVEEIVSGLETAVTCRTANSPYPFGRVYPIDLEDGDMIEIKIKGDSTFTVTMDEFSTTLTKYY